MKLPKVIKGRHKIRDGNICQQWLDYLDSDDDLHTVMEFKNSLVEQTGLSYRYINKILRDNSVVLQPNRQAERNKRFWKLKLIAKGKLKSSKDITDILEQQRKEMEGDKPLIDNSQHLHFTNLSDADIIKKARENGLTLPTAITNRIGEESKSE